ncbi:hypothetical protein E5D57_013251 [Metarhizium anisopliae]|nr:hypothetical protein E5D57_013251 [Metarhizium anisopliae]
MAGNHDVAEPSTKRRKTNPVPVSLAVDVGTSGTRASITWNNKTRNVPMGYRTDHDGKSAPYYSFSTAMISAPHGLELAGLRPISQYGDEHYGLKELLDDRLCREEGPGKGFRDLCAKRGTTHWDALRLLLQDRWHYINNQIRTMVGNVDFEITEVVFTVPASQASDDLLEGETYGRDIQAGMTQCAIEAGIPENIIAPFRTEPEAIASYVASRDAKPVKSRRRKTPQHDEARIVGGHGAAYEEELQLTPTYLVLEGRAILLRKPEGRSVGIGRLWHLWERECQSWVTDANPWKDISRDLRYHVHEMPEGCSGFKRGDKTIRASDFQKDLNDCCDKALRLLETELWSVDEAKIDRLRTVRLHGAALSNPHIKSYFLKSLDSICIRMREGGRKAEFEVDILDRKEDENAVARGASRPFSKNPLPGFRRAVVGVMATLPVRSDAPIVVGEAPLQKAVLEFKAPGKLEVESGYEQMTVATEPDDFWIELQELMLLDKPLEGKVSDNTGRPYWSDEYAMPMGPQKFDLTGLRSKGDKVWVKLMRETSTLYDLEVNCGDENPRDEDAADGHAIRRRLKLYKDGEMEFFDVASDEDKADGHTNVSRRVNGRGTRSDGLDTALWNGRAASSTRYPLRSKGATDVLPGRQETAETAPEAGSPVLGSDADQVLPIGKRVSQRERLNDDTYQVLSDGEQTASRTPAAHTPLPLRKPAPTAPPIEVLHTPSPPKSTARIPTKKMSILHLLGSGI